MSITIKEIQPKKKELKKYVRLGIDLYRGNRYYVPPLIIDEVNTLLPSKNPAFDFCKAQSFIAFRNGRPAGRITAIINSQVNNRSGKKELRFGFMDFIDDEEVSKALFDAAIKWGKDHGMTSIVGPMGFTDMDHEGLLIEGFDEMGTMATIYNYPYYSRHLENLGFKKDIDWVEYRITIPSAIPEKYARISEIVKRKYNLRVLKFTSRKKVRQQYGQALFNLINEAYDHLYGYSPLTPRQIDYYINLYLGILRLEDVCVVVDSNDSLVGVGITISSFSNALRRSNGRLFPFGWRHFIKPLRGKENVVDLLLVAVKPEYQNKGVNSLIFCDLIPIYIKNGYKFAESNPELECNDNVQKQWDYFEHRQHRRRRAYSMEI